MHKFKAVFAAVAVAAGLMGVSPAGYAAWPGNKTVTVIIPRNAGGGVDMTARSIVGMMQKDLGKAKFTFVNKPDNNGIAALEELAGAKPDGYTLGMVTVELDMFPHLGKTKFTCKDFDGIIAPLATPAALIVSADSNFKNLKEFVEHLKKHPGQISIGNSGAGAIWHMAARAFEKELGVKVKHMPYPNGTAEIAEALTGGKIAATFADPLAFKNRIDAGNLRILAVMAAKRTNMFPDVPTFRELGYNLTIRAWAALAAPKGTPADVMKTLRSSAERVVKTADFKTSFLQQGIDPTDIIGEDVNKMMAEDDVMYGNFIKEIATAK